VVSQFGDYMPSRISKRFEVLSRDQIYRIHLLTLKILEEIGVKVNHEEALRRLNGLGAEVDYSSMIVKIPEDLLKETLRSLPSRFTYYGRRLSIDVEDGVINYLDGGAPLRVMDLNGDIRGLTLRDIEALVRIYDALNSIDFIAGPGFPVDVPASMQLLETYFVKLKNTVKPIAPTSMLSEDDVDNIVKIASILAGGVDELRRKPSVIAWENPLSPLSHIKNQLHQVLAFAKLGLPILVASAPQSGSTAPITLAGFLAQQNAEILSSFVIAYSASEKGKRPPVVYGTAPAIFDQRYGTMVYSCPEGMLLNVASIQLARFYGFPTRGTAGTTESKDVDMQAGFEAGMSLLVTALAGCNLIMNAGGGMMGPGVDIVSFEKAIIDGEIVSYVDRILNSIDVNEEELAFEAIREVGPEGHYLRSKHTLRNLSKYRQPKIVDRKSTSRWLNEKKGLREKARETALKILREHQPEPLDKDVEIEIRKIIEEARRKRAK